MTETKKAVIENVKDFNTDHIFDCGQCFRFEKEKDGSWTGTAFDRIINVRFEPYNEAGEENSFGETTGNAPCEGRLCDGAAGDAPCEGRLIIENAGQDEAERIWRPYFDLDRDYGAIKKELSEQDPVIDKAIGCGYGIRILRQDPWEAVVSFIISQNNNIPRIRKIIESLCEKYGEKKGDMYAFPTPRQLAEVSEEDYFRLRMGFRAKYVHDAVSRVVSGEIDPKAIEDMDHDEASKYLEKIKGVGPKVADCVLLFSCRKYDSLPKDVWINRRIRLMFRDGLPECIRGYEGIAQQYIFQYARHNLEKGQ